MLSKKLKEFSDGETTIALTSVTVGEEVSFSIWRNAMGGGAV